MVVTTCKSISSRAPNKAPQPTFRSPAPKNRPSRAPRGPFFAGSGRNWRRRTQPEPGALGGAGRIVFGAKAPRASRVSNTARLVFPTPRVPAGNQWQGCRRSALPLIPHGRRIHGAARRRLPSLGHVHTDAARLYMASLACDECHLFTSPERRRRSFLPSHSISPMAERFPGDEAAANGFGCRSLRE